MDNYNYKIDCTENNNFFIVSDVLLNGADAQTIHIIELLQNMAKTNKVICFVPKPKKILYKLKEISYIPVINKLIPFSISYQIALFFYLISHCIKRRPDWIYERQSGFSFSPLIISWFLKIPYFTEVNGLLIDESRIIGTSKWIISIKKVNERLSYAQAKKIIAVTQGVKEGIKLLYNIPDDKIVVVENGANIELFKQKDQKEAKEKLNLDQKCNYICFIGNLAPWQGVEYLIQSAPLVINEILNVKFLIIGDGLMKKNLMELAEKTGVFNKFIFTGTVPYEEVTNYINASDICVAPFIRSRNEKIGLSPLKLYEYMACGKPVVASNILGVGDILEHEKTGISVKSEDPQELGNAIVKLLKDEKLRNEMGLNGRKYVSKNHSWDGVAKKITSICIGSILK